MMATKINTIRKERGLTQEELADKAGITVRTIQRIENNATVPRAYTLRKIAEVLQVPVEEFTRAAGEKPVAAPADSLRWLNLSCFSCLLIPYVHALVPYYIWKKNKTAAGKKIIRFQVGWTIALHLLLVLTLCYNLLANYFFQQQAFLLPYLWVALGMFLFNFFIILRTEFRLMSGK